MANLVTINPLVSGAEGFVFPTPSKYTATTSTIVDSARNANGVMIGSVIRSDVAKIQMSWNYIDASDWAAILQQFEPAYGGAFIRRVTFFNQTYGYLSTRDMYVSDRTADSFLLHSWTNTPDLSYFGLPRGYKDASLSLIEV